jgi:1,6-anhydro-N-acetylmuramate kinase
VYSVLDDRKKPRGRRTTSTRKDLANRVYASDEAREYATSKGEELQEKLGSDYPTFVKPLTQSHVSGGFWLVIKHPPTVLFTPRMKPTACCW